jgi:hypothetical protein
MRKLEYAAPMRQVSLLIKAKKWYLFVPTSHSGDAKAAISHNDKRRNPAFCKVAWRPEGQITALYHGIIAL